MKRLLLIITGLFAATIGHGQSQRSVDSLSALLLTLDDSDTNKVRVLSQLAWDISYFDLDTGLTISQLGIALAREQGYKIGEAEALSVAGTIYADLGRYAEAIDAHLHAIRLREQGADPGRLGESYYNIALVYESMDSTNTSLKYNQLAYEYYKSGKDSSGLGPVCNYLGEYYLGIDSVDRAEHYFNEGNLAARSYKLKRWIAQNTSGLAFCAALKKDFLKSARLMGEAFEIAKSEGNEYNMMSAWMNVARLRQMEGNYPAAIEAVDSALRISTKLDVRDALMWQTRKKAELLELNGDLVSALDYLRRYQQLKDTILSSKNQQNIRNLEAVYEKEKTEQALEILREDGRLQKIYVAGGIVSSVGFIVIAFLLFGRIRMGKKAGQLLVEKKAIIESKNKDITDSINYARRIQDAVTPVEGQLKNIFTDSFVFNRPRSIVTGDFWWMAEADDRYFVVTGDCSGHGVPGGFMSVMAASFLNGIIIEQGVHSPEQILFELNKKIRAALQHSGTKDSAPLVSDTIEIAICSFSKTLTNALFASAGMPVTFVRKHQVIEYRGSEFRAGAVNAESNPFTLSSTELQKGDQLFLFSDGLLALPGVDQRHIHDLLVKVNSSYEIERFIQAHCGNYEQPDDVLVIGMKV